MDCMQHAVPSLLITNALDCYFKYRIKTSLRRQYISLFSYWRNKIVVNRFSNDTALNCLELILRKIWSGFNPLIYARSRSRSPASTKSVTDLNGSATAKTKLAFINRKTSLSELYLDLWNLRRAMHYFGLDCVHVYAELTSADEI